MQRKAQSWIVTVKDVWDLAHQTEGNLCCILGTATGK
jgi:hypothetical protein